MHPQQYFWCQTEDAAVTAGECFKNKTSTAHEQVGIISDFGTLIQTIQLSTLKNSNSYIR